MTPRQRDKRREASFERVRGLYGEACDAKQAGLEEAAVAIGERVADRDPEVGEVAQGTLEPAQ